jgi:membrane-associated phospholipid phosphatase
VVAAWLLLLTAGQLAAFVAVWRFFVESEPGQVLDTIALTGNTIGRGRVDPVVRTVLNAVSALSILAATVVIGFIALIRRRVLLAIVATVLVVGATVTAQLLKAGIDRPDLGIDPERAAAGNSLPSGHTAVAASVALALVLVLPPRVRGLGALVGTAYTAVAGVATLSAGWHRPSDSVAAVLIAGAWATAAGFLLASSQREPGPPIDQPHVFALMTLVLAGVVLLSVAVLALSLTDQVTSIPPVELGRRRLFTAYAGSAAGIAGSACLVMAFTLATVHKAVPTRAG